MTEPTRPTLLRWLTARRLAALLLAVVALGVVAAVAARPWLSAYVRRQIIEQAGQHFDATVDLGDVAISVLPRIRLSGEHLVLTRQGAADPLIRIGRFTITTSLLGLVRRTIDRVEVDEVAITIPPDRASPDSSSSSPSPPTDDGGAPARAGGESVAGGLDIGEIVSTNAVLTIQPDEPDGTPQIFDIARVRLEGFSLEGPADYEASLVNPRPRGPIESSGRFGPWNASEPRLTPLEGDYALHEANMAAFDGLGGRLTAVGQFNGVLEAIEIAGSSTMPDFSVDAGSHPMRLDTWYQALVDGTNGNTYLTRVDAVLGESPIQASGSVAGTPGSEGKRITLDVTSEGGRLEDFIYLVVDAPDPPLVGRIDLVHTLDLPPGAGSVVERLRLNGRFTIAEGQFSSDAVQEKLDELSRRGQGEPGNEAIRNVISTFSGRFAMRDGTISLPQLGFAVSGARLDLSGAYGVPDARLDFAGTLRLDASLSETTTGWKSWLLKAVDPFFEGDHAGAEVPIKVSGTARQPSVGLDF